MNYYDVEAIMLSRRIIILFSIYYMCIKKTCYITINIVGPIVLYYILYINTHTHRQQSFGLPRSLLILYYNNA